LLFGGPIQSYCKRKKGGKTMIRRILVLFALLFLVFPTIVHSAEVLSVADFESSTFYKKYSVREKDVWTLRSGGKNFHYSYKDPENPYSGFSVELSSDPSNIRKIGISWSGKSIYHPAQLTKVREQFLRDLLLVVEPTVDPDTVIAYVKSQQVNNYPGGSNTMPRKQLGKAAIYAGTVGEGLIVGIMIGSFSSDDSGNKSPDMNLLPHEVDGFYVGKRPHGLGRHECG
jgi:hypothetical protein